MWLLHTLLRLVAIIIFPKTLSLMTIPPLWNKKLFYIA